MNSRRSLLLAAAAPLLVQSAHAGTQVEEPLADSVRTAWSAAIASAAPPKPSFEHIEDRIAYLRWLGQVSQRLMPRLAEHQTRVDLLGALWYESKRAGLEPALVLGVVQVESGFRKYAISSAGARGYMQVMPFWARLIGDGDAAKLFHLHQAQHQCWLQPGAFALVPERAQQIDAALVVAQTRHQPLADLAKPAQVGDAIFDLLEAGFGWRGTGNRGGQGRAH